MIDIIIPAYNAHSTIVKTLLNLKLQTAIEKANVYIVNDCSVKDYKKEIDIFKDEMNIVELKTPHNMGPGAARQYALNQTKGKYIVFLDADDQLYNPYILNYLYTQIESLKMNMVYGDEIIEDKGINKDCVGSLHGKIYRRSFIEKNKVKFNNTRYSEDDSFNKLIMNLTNKVKKINMVTYLYLNNSSSITSNNDKKVKILMMYIYNMIWVSLELKKRKVNTKKIAKILLTAYTYVYMTITQHKETNYYYIYEKCFRLEELFSKYENNLSEKDIKNSIKNNIYCENEKTIISQFNIFRNKFKNNNHKIDIIIPAYNAHSYILDALFSIAIQTISGKVNVYIVNDCSSRNYSKEISKVKSFINVVELKTPERLGPAGARQYGLDKSNEDYVMFLDADDILNDGLSLKNMFEYMNDYDCDALSSLYNEETDSGFAEQSTKNMSLHGKMYKRTYLKSRHIKFNNTMLCTEESFNYLVELTTNIYSLETYTYIKRNILNSLYKSEKNIIKYKILNIVWVIKEAEEKQCLKPLIYNYICNQVFDLYYNYITTDNYFDREEIEKNSFELYEYYKKYEALATSKENNANIKKFLINTYFKLDNKNIASINISYNDFLNIIGKNN